jgi:polyhydroxyalkanoate synthesis regulator phasin
VRYVVLPQGENNTVLRIDALFKEDFRHIVHPSNGSVENAEYKDIREHLDGIEFMKAQDIEAQRERREQLAKKRNLAVGNDAAPPATGQSSSQPELQAAENDPVPAAAPATATQEPPEVSSSAPPDQPLEERIKDLRKQVVRLVKSPGAPLKSAPFHTAGTLQLLGTGTEVLIVINSPYWYGVETHEGQHGWVLRDQLELLP